MEVQQVRQKIRIPEEQVGALDPWVQMAQMLLTIVGLSLAERGVSHTTILPFLSSWRPVPWAAPAVALPRPVVSAVPAVVQFN
jgi:hypothetical protein